MQMVEQIAGTTGEELAALYRRCWGPLGIPTPSPQEIRDTLDRTVAARVFRHAGRLDACLIWEGRGNGEVWLTVLGAPGFPTTLLTEQVARSFELLPSGTRRVLAAVPDQDTPVHQALGAAGFVPQRVFVTMRRPYPCSQPSPSPEREAVIGYDVGRQEEVRQLCNETFSGHWGTTPWSADDWEEDVVGSDGFLPECSFLHTDNAGRVDAFALCSRERSAPQSLIDVDLVGTRADARGRGHATNLLRQVIDAADATGCGLELIVDSDGDAAALRLYRALGFEPVGTESIFVIDHGDDQL